LKYKKYIKRIFIGLLSCILALIISVFILITFYKKELTSNLISNLKEQYDLDLKVEDVDVSFFNNWPNASVQLKNISLCSNSAKEKPMLTAGSLAFSLDVAKLIQKQFIVESVFIKDARLDLLKYSDGQSNFEFKKDSAKLQTKQIKFEIKKIAIKNLQFNFADEERGQKIDIKFIDNTIKLKHQLDGIEAGLFGDVSFGGLLFKKEKGAFLKNTNASLDLYASVFLSNRSVFVHKPSAVTIANHHYNISSYLELNDKKQLLVSLDSKSINFEKGIALLNHSLQKKLNNFTVKKDIDAQIMIIANLGVKQDPIIISKLSSRNNNVTIGNSKIPYNNISFNGLIYSLDPSRTKGNTENARMIFKDIKGDIYSFPFTASVTLNNFDDPFININAALFINASKVKFKNSDDISLSGNCVAKISYAGPANKLNKEEFLDEPMKLRSSLFFNAVSYRENTKPYVYTIDGNANLSNKDLRFENLLLKTDAGNVILKGNVLGFTNYAMGYSNGFKTNLVAKAESFNLNPYLVNKPKNKITDQNKAAYKKTIKQEQGNFDFNVSLLAKKLFIRNVKATNASVTMSYKNKLLDVKSVNMQACKGKLSAKGTVYDLNKITADVKIEGMDVNTLFDEFENFGQKAVTSKNLQGNIFVDAKLKTELDENMEVIGNTMNGEIKLKLTNGHLLNFEPLQHISDYVFRNRDFKDISFSELNETCKIKGFEMEIQEMEIASSVLNLFVFGKYHFKDNSNINILIPWSNLKKRGKNYIPKNSGQTVENSKGLKLNYSGPPKKLKLSLGHRTI